MPTGPGGAIGTGRIEVGQDRSAFNRPPHSASLTIRWASIEERGWLEMGDQNCGWCWRTTGQDLFAIGLESTLAAIMVTLFSWRPVTTDLG